jgi:predicted amino acid racemase
MEVLAMNYPLVEINLAKITHNAMLLAEECRERKIDLVGVTKAFCADLKIAKAMLDGGIKTLGDSRIQNLRKLRQAGLQVPLLLLRIPMPSEVNEVVRIADCSLVSELDTVGELSKAAQIAGLTHDIVLMVDMGDLREGIIPENVLPQVAQILRYPGIQLQGLGANFACYGGVAPTAALLNGLRKLAEQVRDQYSIPLPVVSGGNSANIGMLEAGTLPDGINQLRIGEGILLGRETIQRQPISGAYQDAFILYAEVVEIQEKPSCPCYASVEDAFGNKPTFVDRGIRRRAIVAIGRQDVSFNGLAPLNSGIEILGGSSDHLILDVSDALTAVKVGSVIGFSMQYSALLSAMTSPYVDKKYRTYGNRVDKEAEENYLL